MFQTTGQELADNLKIRMSDALRKYHEINKQLPDRIIIYRDGVGDGQLPAVVEHELPQIISSFAEQGGGYKYVSTDWCLVAATPPPRFSLLAV